MPAAGISGVGPKMRPLAAEFRATWEVDLESVFLSAVQKIGRFLLDDESSLKVPGGTQ